MIHIEAEVFDGEVISVSRRSHTYVIKIGSIEIETTQEHVEELLSKLQGAVEYATA